VCPKKLGHKDARVHYANLKQQTAPHIQARPTPDSSVVLSRQGTGRPFPQDPTVCPPGLHPRQPRSHSHFLHERRNRAVLAMRQYTPTD